MINVVVGVDFERKIKINEQLKKTNLEFHFLNGVLVKNEDVIFDNIVKKAGNVGCMLSKFFAWEWVSSKDEPCNIIEDDELIPEEYALKRSELLKEIKHDYDFIFLNVLRPCGEKYSKNFLKISKNKCNYAKCCNVWNCNYIITPKFASILLNAVKEHKLFKYVFKKIASDKVVSSVLTDLSSSYNFFTIAESNFLTKHFDEQSLRKHNNEAY
jgi:GR25 family glycosyltransferase involved in LPS biosynthesis